LGALAFSLMSSLREANASAQSIILGYIGDQNNISTKMVAYYPGWVSNSNNFNPNLIDGKQFTHINYAFVGFDKDGNLISGAVAQASFEQLRALKQKYGHIKTLVSVGGGSFKPELFSHVAAHEKTRTQFVQSCVQFCKTYGFDGIDLDWEYPRSADKQNFTLLLKELFQAGKKVDPAFVISIAGPVNFAKLACIDLPAIAPFIDWINVMAYDFHGPWKGSIADKMTHHHAPLFFSGTDFQELCIDAVINYYQAHKIPAEKLILGIPLYGRSYGGVTKTETGLFCDYTCPGSGVLRPGIHTYSHIQNNIAKTYTEFWDDKAQAAYYYNSALSDFISCETPRSLVLKAQYIKKRALGGAMFWALYNPEICEATGIVYGELCSQK